MSKTLFYGGTIYPCDPNASQNESVLEKAFLLIEDEHILDIGKMSDARFQGYLNDDDLQKHSFEDQFMSAGFVDAHVHMGLYPEGFVGEPKDLNELSHPITPQLRALDGIWTNDIAFKKAKAGGVTTICVLPGSANVIGGMGVVLKTHGIDIEEMTILEPACLKVSFGYNVKHNHGSKGKAPLTRMAIADMFRQSFEQALRYEEQKLLRSDTPIDRGKEALLMALKQEIPVRAHASRVDDILTAIRLSKEFGLKLVIEHGYEAKYITEKLVKNKVSVVYGPAFRTCGHSEDMNFDFADAQLLLDAGITVAQMTDHPIVPVQYLNLQAGLCVREGLDPLKALLLITAYPAQILGCEQRIGSLKIKKDADFVIFNHFPLSVEAKVQKTYIQGKKVYDCKEI
jgi:imidazolonepropionase-like amidohydrolase